MTDREQIEERKKRGRDLFNEALNNHTDYYDCRKYIKNNAYPTSAMELFRIGKDGFVRIKLIALDLLDKHFKIVTAEPMPYPSFKCQLLSMVDISDGKDYRAEVILKMHKDRIEIIAIKYLKKIDDEDAPPAVPSDYDTRSK